MDFKNQIDEFEDVGMLNPFETTQSFVKAHETLKYYNFNTEVYPDTVISELLEATKEHRNIKPPKCIFVPSKKIVRIMIKAMAEFATRDSQECFLLRFGLLDDPNWYLKQDPIEHMASVRSGSSHIK
jgi:hypothetical protein